MGRAVGPLELPLLRGWGGVGFTQRQGRSKPRGEKGIRHLSPVQFGGDTLSPLSNSAEVFVQNWMDGCDCHHSRGPCVGA